MPARSNSRAYKLARHSTHEPAVLAEHGKGRQAIGTCRHDLRRVEAALWICKTTCVAVAPRNPRTLVGRVTQGWWFVSHVRRRIVQGYFAHKTPPPPPASAQEPRGPTEWRVLIREVAL